MSRPGVATSTSTPRASAWVWGRCPTPPNTTATREAEMPAVGAEALGDLGGKLAGGAEHQNAAALARRRAAVGCQAMEDRQRERGGLAGAGLGDAEQVAAGQNDRDGLGLDGGGRLRSLRPAAP